MKQDSETRKMGDLGLQWSVAPYRTEKEKVMTEWKETQKELNNLCSSSGITLEIE
jgi:hypothetical protein